MDHMMTTCDGCEVLTRKSNEDWIHFTVIPSDKGFHNLTYGDIKCLDFCSRECIAKFAIDGGFENE